MLHITKINPEFTDTRGAISRIVEIDSRMKVALFISSKAGSIRANHYHKHDTHYTFLLSGKFEYIEKDLMANAKIESQVIVPGDLVISPPNRIHAMKFLEDSTMVVISTEPRDQQSYEADTIRTKLV